MMNKNNRKFINLLQTPIPVHHLQILKVAKVQKIIIILIKMKKLNMDLTLIKMKINQRLILFRKQIVNLKRKIQFKKPRMIMNLMRKI
jgi:hypothetical protein